MSKNKSRRTSFGQRVKQFSLSIFVLFTFVAYAIHERIVGTQDLGTASIAPIAPAAANQQGKIQPSKFNPSSVADSATVNVSQVVPTDVPQPSVPTIPTSVPPTAVPPTATPEGQYRDGTYVGSVADAFYGNVQVQATVQNGKIIDIQPLQYPNHRRLSQQISQQALPWLETEAMQVQSAHVHIVSGATLTSEAFAQSLNNALLSAQ